MSEEMAHGREALPRRSNEVTSFIRAIAAVA
jgi:hypothetical protein